MLGTLMMADGPPAITFTVMFFGQWFLNLNWSLVADITLVNKQIVLVTFWCHGGVSLRNVIVFPHASWISSCYQCLFVLFLCTLASRTFSAWSPWLLVCWACRWDPSSVRNCVSATSVPILSFAVWVCCFRRRLCWLHCLSPDWTRPRALLSSFSAKFCSIWIGPLWPIYCWYVIKCRFFYPPFDGGGPFFKNVFSFPV